MHNNRILIKYERYPDFGLLDLTSFVSQIFLFFAFIIYQRILNCFKRKIDSLLTIELKYLNKIKLIWIRYTVEDTFLVVYDFVEV